MIQKIKVPKEVYDRYFEQHRGTPGQIMTIAINVGYPLGNAEDISDIWFWCLKIEDIWESDEKDITGKIFDIYDIRLQDLIPAVLGFTPDVYTKSGWEYEEWDFDVAKFDEVLTRCFKGIVDLLFEVEDAG